MTPLKATLAAPAGELGRYELTKSDPSGLREHSASRPSLSLQSRQLIASMLALMAFLGLTGYALDRAFSETALDGLERRLQSHIYGLIAGVDLTPAGGIIVPAAPPDPRLAQPGSGLYATVSTPTERWQSPSMMGRDPVMQKDLLPGQRHFSGPDGPGKAAVFSLALGVQWELDDTVSLPVTVTVAEERGELDRDVRVFRQALWFGLGSAGALLLLVQLVVQRWSFEPLRRVVRELGRVERGDNDRIAGRYPQELSPLTDAVNALISTEREHRERYRNSLADLAHSLKTPLAVMRAQLDDAAALDVRDRAELGREVTRMDELVHYQLGRAALAGRQVFATPLDITEHAEPLVQGLEKVYADKNLLLEFDIDDDACFHGEAGDLLELLGNLLENACKWARHRVLLRARAVPEPWSRRDGLTLDVEDDGPGIAADQVARLLQRGVRGDERVQGHGIGLAIVQDIIRAYGGTLGVERSDELGGARFRVHLPAN